MGLCTVQLILRMHTLRAWSWSKICILDSTRTCLEVSCSLAMCYLCYCIIGYPKVNTALNSTASLLRYQIWRSLSPILRKCEWLVCHSTIVRSPNPTSPLRNPVRQFHAGFTILAASNRQILFYKLLVCWTYGFELYLSRKVLLQVFAASISNFVTFLTETFLILKHTLKEKKTKALLDKKNILLPQSSLGVLALNMCGVFLPKWLSLAFTKQLNC